MMHRTSLLYLYALWNNLCPEYYSETVTPQLPGANTGLPHLRIQDRCREDPLASPTKGVLPDSSCKPGDVGPASG
jgi:hypothetical protein